MEKGKCIYFDYLILKERKDWWAKIKLSFTKRPKRVLVWWSVLGLCLLWSRSPGWRLKVKDAEHRPSLGLMTSCGAEPLWWLCDEPGWADSAERTVYTAGWPAHSPRQPPDRNVQVITRICLVTTSIAGLREPLCTCIRRVSGLVFRSLWYWIIQ